MPDALEAGAGAAVSGAGQGTPLTVIADFEAPVSEAVSHGAGLTSRMSHLKACVRGEWGPRGVSRQIPVRRSIELGESLPGREPERRVSKRSPESAEQSRLWRDQVTAPRPGGLRMVSIWWAYLSGQWNVESGNAAATDAGLVAEADKKLTEACTAVFKAYLKQPVINPPGNDVAAPAYQSAAQDFNIIPSLALTAPRF